MYSMAQEVCKFVAVLLYAFMQCAEAQQSVAIREIFEMHSVLASGSIKQIYVAGNVSTSSSRVQQTACKA
jgi:hypothetical protein